MSILGVALVLFILGILGWLVINAIWRTSIYATDCLVKIKVCLINLKAD